MKEGETMKTKVFKLVLTLVGIASFIMAAVGSVRWG